MSTIGNSGTGTLDIDSLSAASAFVVVGDGQSLIAGGLIVGDAATGELQVSAGGTVATGSLEIGAQAGSSGTVAISGAGSFLTLSGDLGVGVGGIGDLAISGGATVAAASAEVGLNLGSSGVIDLEGAGTELQIAGDLNIDSGVVIVGAGATLDVAGEIKVSGSGHLEVLGGLVDPTIAINTGVGPPQVGTLVATVEIQNTGTYQVSGSSITSLGTFTLVTPLITNDGTAGDTGVLQVLGFGDLVLDAGTVDNTQTVDFATGNHYGLLTIGTIGGFGAAIDGFNSHDEILIQGASIVSTTPAGTTIVAGTTLDLLTLLGPGNTPIGQLEVTPDVTGANLTALETANAEGGLGAMACFAAGTRISTQRGEIPIESLREGDHVRLAARPPLPRAGESLPPDHDPGVAARSGEGTPPRTLPVHWIGHRRVDCRQHPKPRTVWPVRIAAEAFGPGLPARDLLLSPDHALFVGGVLIPVKHLINGTSVVQVPVDTITYYHVELPRHDVLLAEGLAAESYLETGGRRMFANGGGPIALHPDFATRVWEAEACAPLIVTGPELEHARTMLAGRAKAAA